ncbi:MAG: hypothetical protein RR614_12060, partial [Eubacterium sp.]
MKTVLSGKKWLLPLFVLLLIIVMLTSSIVGFILGRNTSDGQGQVIDTIVVDPDQESQKTISFVGVIHKPDGSPDAGVTVELHSTPRQAVTDSLGRFSLENVELGSHTLSILDETGKASSRCAVILNKNGGNLPKMSAQNGGYSVAVNSDSRVLEMSFDLNGDGTTLTPDAQRIVSINGTGTVATPQGIATVKDGVIITPGGTVITTDGTVLMPGGKIVTTDGSVIPLPPEGYRTSDGTALNTDGTVVTREGQSINVAKEMQTMRDTGEIGIVIDNDADNRTPIGQEAAVEDEDEAPRTPIEAVVEFFQNLIEVILPQQPA